MYVDYIYKYFQLSNLIAIAEIIVLHFYANEINQDPVLL